MTDSSFQSIRNYAKRILLIYCYLQEISFLMLEEVFGGTEL